MRTTPASAAATSVASQRSLPLHSDPIAATKAQVEARTRRRLALFLACLGASILTALFLYWVGTGPVRGFAVTLILGILSSMITAIFVTRTFFLMYLERRPGLQTLSI